MTRETFIFDSAAIPGVLRRIWIQGDVQAHILGPYVGQDGSDTTLERYKPFILGSTEVKTIYRGDDVMDADSVVFKGVPDGSIVDSILISSRGVPLIFMQNVSGLPLVSIGEGDVGILWSKGRRRIVSATNPEQWTQRHLYQGGTNTETSKQKTGAPNETI